MASILKRNRRYHAQIRKNGYPSVTKTLIHLQTAGKWASSVEADMERQRYCPIQEATQLGKLFVNLSPVKNSGQTACIHPHEQ